MTMSTIITRTVKTMMNLMIKMSTLMMTKPIVIIVMILSKLSHRCYERNFKQLRIEA